MSRISLFSFGFQCNRFEITFYYGGENLTRVSGAKRNTDGVSEMTEMHVMASTRVEEISRDGVNNTYLVQRRLPVCVVRIGNEKVFIV